MNDVNSTITVTAAAAAYIHKCLAKRGGGLGLRLHIEEAGCSGYKYEIDYVDAATATDKVFPIDDSIAVYVEKQIFPYVMGTIIDYRKEGLNSKLIFENPNQTGGCGCGESFTVD